MRLTHIESATNPEQGQAERIAKTSFFFQNNPSSFCWCLLVLIVIALITPLLLVKTGIYNRMASGQNFEANLDYPFEVSSKSYDVVIYGDSTGLLDIDPKIVTNKLGLSSINLSQAAPFLQLVGEFGLDSYLSRNRKPKLLVLAISPSNVSLTANADVQGFYGWYTLIRHGAPKDALDVFLRRPSSLPNFWSSAMHQMFGTKRIGNGYFQSHQQVLSGNGYTPYPVKVPLASCRALKLEEKRVIEQHAYIDHFVSKYRVRGLSVAVFLTPVPDCNPNLNVFESTLQGIASNGPYGISRYLFANDKQAAHALSETVPQITSDLVDAIRPVLGAADLRAAIQQSVDHNGVR